MQSIAQITQDTLQKAGEYILNGTKDGSLRKSQPTITGAAGDTLSGTLTGINLQAPAKQLVPLLSPFRQMIARSVRAGSVASNWKAITALTSGKLSSAPDSAGNAFTTSVAARVAAFRVMAMLGQVNREQVAASEGFDPALAKETANTLLIAMKLEEQYMLGGNVTALTTPTAPVAAVAVVGGGSVSGTGNDALFQAGNNRFKVAALTLPAANRFTVQRPSDFSAAALTTTATLQPQGIAGTSSTLNGLATLPAASSTSPGSPGSDGVTVLSAVSNTLVTALADSVLLTWPAVPGAAAYAIFSGITDDAALVAQCIVTQTRVILLSKVTAATVPFATTQAALTGSSADANSYDGIVAQLNATGSGAYIQTLAGALTSPTGTGELVQLQDAFAAIYSTAKIGKFMVLVAANEGRTITKLGIAAGGGPTIFVDPNAIVRNSLMQGYHVGSIINAVTGDTCPIYTMPWFPGGTILILPTEIPFPDSNTPAPFDWVGGYDWERWDYSSTVSTGPVYPFEVRSYGVLRGIFTGGCGIIQNIFKS